MQLKHEIATGFLASNGRQFPVMAHDRDEFVRLLTDYYNFCNRAFWNATVAQAPSGGWTSINQETLAPLKRNGTVFDLLRHMPYIDSPGN